METRGRVRATVREGEPTRVGSQVIVIRRGRGAKQFDVVADPATDIDKPQKGPNNSAVETPPK